MIFDSLDIEEKIGTKLYDLAVNHELPLNESVSINCFQNALSSIGGINFRNLEKNRPFTIDLNKIIGNVRISPSVSFDREALFGGYGTEVRGSIQTLKGAISLAFHKFGQFLPNNFDRENWYNFEERASNQSKISLEQELRKNFIRYHDNVLKDIECRDSRLTKSTSLAEVCREYPLEVYAKVLEIWRDQDFQREEVTLGQMLEEDWYLYDDDRCPTPETFIGFIWGAYLSKIALKKQYETNFTNNLLKGFVLAGGFGLKNGRQMFGTPIQNRENLRRLHLG